MSKRLKDNITSKYFAAANKLGSKKARRRIAAYVESYDDIFFWRTVLSPLEDSTRYFEVMLPSKDILLRGKKSVLMNVIADKAGPDMIACVDADYDYLMQGLTPTSEAVISNPYVFHTYVYAIENYQCYAAGLHDVCVMVTLNDHAVFDFQDYMAQYSEACFPLFVWSVWAYRTGNYPHFSISDFCRITDPGRFNIDTPEESIIHLRNKVSRRVCQLRRHYPNAKEEYLRTKALLRELGVTPRTTYLYMQGHHIFDTVVVPIMTKVCNRLRQEREREIHSTAAHHTQMRNEMSCYENSIADIRSMLRRTTGYTQCPLFARLQKDILRFVSSKVQTGTKADGCIGTTEISVGKDSTAADGNE